MYPSTYLLSDRKGGEFESVGIARLHSTTHAPQQFSGAPDIETSGEVRRLFQLLVYLDFGRVRQLVDVLAFRQDRGLLLDKLSSKLTPHDCTVGDCGRVK